MDRINILRRYTGFNGNSVMKLAGTERFVTELEIRTRKGLHNVGTWMVRLKRGKQTQSVHGTGRAMDISWRGTRDGRKLAVKWMNELASDATVLGIELIIDYGAKPWGRSWRCDTMKWRRYLKPTVEYGGKGDWFHLELDGYTARNPGLIRDMFTHRHGDIPHITPSPL